MQLKVRNAAGQMVPLATLATARDISGPVMVMRYNMYPAAADQRQRGPGHQLRPGDPADGSGWPTRCCRRRWPTSGPN